MGHGTATGGNAAGEVRITSWIAVALALVAALQLGACTRGAAGPVDVSLAELATQEDAYAGRLVRTQGVVRTFEDPRHYWIEDAYPNRVGLEPGERATPFVGSDVSVVGRFRFDERKGRIIEVERITAGPGRPPNGRSLGLQARCYDWSASMRIS